MRTRRLIAPSLLFVLGILAACSGSDDLAGGGLSPHKPSLTEPPGTIGGDVGGGKDAGIVIGGEAGADGSGPGDASPHLDASIDNDGGGDSGATTCAQTVCGANATCNDTTGTAVCTCDVGFVGDGLICIAGRDCSTDPCWNGAICIDGAGGFTCVCPAGYAGATCETNIDDCASNPCLNGGTCVDGVNAFTCTCAPGFSGTTCETNIDDCASNPCLNGGTCVDGVNAFTCTCAPGFTGTTCETDIDECASNPCLNGGTCVDGINAFTCACPAGYAGTTCETKSGDCVPNPCQNGGTCDAGALTCTCAPGFTGPTCETNIDECAPNPCLHGGTCVDGIASFTCTCANAWSGSTCAVAPPTCSAIKTANAAAADGVYTIDPSGAGAAFSVYCDMTTDGGGWTKILQLHDVPYTPTGAASGDVTTANTPAFAKLSDASINALGAALGAGRAYRIQGSLSAKKLFIFSAGTFTDSAVGFGLMRNSLRVCEDASFAACAPSTVSATYIDSQAWSLAGNNSDRYLADVGGSVSCSNPSATGVRCFNSGQSTGKAIISDLSIWLK